MALKDKCLLLTDVVEVGNIEERTARYVLSRAKDLKLPETAGRGEYRRFDLWQACRLINAVRLVNCNLPLEYTDPIPAKIERRGKAGEGPMLYPFEPDSTRRPWKLRLLSSRYVKVWRKHLPPPHFAAGDDPVYFDARTGRLAPDSVETDDESQVIVEWNLSALGERLYERLRLKLENK